MGTLDRSTQLALLPTGRCWDDVEPPSVLGKASTTNNYAPQWRAFVRAASELGWSPDDVASRGAAALADALAEAGLRTWSPATVTRYAKLARYAGVHPAPHPPPHSEGLQKVDHQRLWTPRAHPASQRNALAAVLTWHWPAELPELLGLKVEELRVTGTGGLAVMVGTGEFEISTGGLAAQRWLTSCQTWGSPRRVFVTTHPSRTGSPPGSPLSTRGFQASFANHAELTGNSKLSWRRYRALAQRT
jgi:hypothetical protein